MKSRLPFYALTAALCMLVSGLSTPLFSQSVKNLSIYYTASIRGNIDGCRCATRPRAGLVKTAVYLKTINHQNALLLDAGDAQDSEPDDLLAAAVYDTMASLKYDLIGIGEKDYANGLPFLADQGALYPLAADNLTISSGGKAVKTDTGRVITKAGLKIGLLALTEPALTPDKAGRDPVKTASDALAGFQAKKTDLNVLIYHGTQAGLKNLLEKAKGFQVALIGHEEAVLNAVKLGDTIVVSPGEDGNRVGLLQLTLENGAVKSQLNSLKKFDYSRDPDDKTVRNRINAYQDEMIKRLQSGDSK